MNIPLNVKKMMDKNVICLDESATVTLAMEKMYEAGVWSVIVTQEDLPKGVVTERDLLRRCFRPKMNPDEVLLGDIMSYPLVTIDSDIPVGSALNLLLTDEIRRLYVINSKGEIIGRVTQTGCLESTLNLITGMQQAFEQI